MQNKITPCLWFDGDAEEAANFYVTLLPDSRVDQVIRSPADNPSTSKGDVLVVEFTLAGQRYSGLNGGPQFPFTEAVSFMIRCEDQAEVDRLWAAIEEGGGTPSACGWIKDWDARQRCASGGKADIKPTLSARAEATRSSGTLRRFRVRERRHAATSASGAADLL
jgi:predicted 3-demethylubiquinone-9 3-methyltransferase (glyoxalase superfamily)